MNENNEVEIGPVDITPIDVKILDGYRIWLRFNDGAEGELDLKYYARKPWFKPWQDRSVFENVRISSYDGLIWGDDPEESDMGICALSLYMELTGKSWEELKYQTSSQFANA